MLKVAICDDNRFMQAKMETLVEELGEKHHVRLEIEVLGSGVELLNDVNRGEGYDIIFLDIRMGHMNGIETAIEIRKFDRAVQIIYVTSYDKYMRSTFQTLPVGFLSKPVEVEELEKIFLKAIEYVSYHKEYYHFEYKKKGYRVPLKNILYFKSDRREVKIIGINGTFQHYEKLSAVENQLAAYKTQFIRIHNRYLVNLNYIEKYTPTSVIMANGVSLPISRDRKKQVHYARR